MKEFDRKIQDALKRDPVADGSDGEPNIAEEVLVAFRGRHRVFSSLMLVVQVVAFVGCVLAALRFYGATEVALQLRWGAVALALLLVSSMLKIWFWLEIHTNRVLREVKRVELMLVSRQRL